MSNQLLSAAFRAELPQARKFVLVALCDYANDAGECFPSITQMMAKCSMSDRGVQKNIVELIDGGYVKRDFRRGRSTVYIITDPRTWFTPNYVHPEQGSPQTRTTFTPEQGSPPNDVHLTPEQGSPSPEPRSPITITQPSINPERVCIAHEGEADQQQSAEPIKPAVRACMAMIAAGIPAAKVSANHPTLVTLIAAGHPPETFAAATPYAIEQVGAENAFVYALGIVRRQAAEALRNPPNKPTATDRIKGKTYVGTSTDKLPAEFREAIAGIGG